MAEAAEERAAALLDSRRALGELSELQALGLRCIPRLLRRCSNKRHLLLFYDLGGAPLSKMLFDLRGVFHGRARVYEIRCGPVLREMRAVGGLRGFRRLARGLLLALAAIHGAGLVHGDLKPDNILLSSHGGGGEEGEEGVDYSSLRVVDFGSSREIVDPATASGGGGGLSGAGSTPEYLPPEVLKGPPAFSFSSFGRVLLVGALREASHITRARERDAERVQRESVRLRASVFKR